jgi:magnesium chelatase subunit I
MNRFPFSAIVAQDEMKQALLLAAVDPSIGGVMVFGDRGTGNRRRRGHLPRSCRPSSRWKAAASAARRPMPAPVQIPVHRRRQPSARALRGPPAGRDGGPRDRRARPRTRAALGEKRFEPGLLAKAHRGFLYIDEINLLEDHLVDLLLDVAASGENLVEREGLSVRHKAKFVLIGSGNPEEGELRPQLLDRFGLSVEVRTPQALDARVEIMRRCASHERDPAAFCEEWAAADAEDRAPDRQGPHRLTTVETPDEVLDDASRLCMACRADGLRGELTLMRAARALAALEGSATVQRKHIIAVAPMALRRRLRRDVLGRDRLHHPHRARGHRGIRMTTPAAPAAEDAALALRALRLRWAGSGGLWLARPARRAMPWSSGLASAVQLRAHAAHIDGERLHGGIDLAASLAAGRSVLRSGFLDEARGAVVLAPLAERITPSLAGSVAQALDHAEQAERFGLVLLDDGAERDEVPPLSLTERVAFACDLGSAAPGSLAGNDRASRPPRLACRDPGLQCRGAGGAGGCLARPGCRFPAARCASPR